MTPPAGDAGSHRGWTQLWDKWGNWVFVIAGAFVVLTALALGTWSYYGYRTGTPATVAVDFCSRNAQHEAKTQNCYATWNVNGVHHYGQIEGADARGYPDGASLAVHVRDDTAFTADAGKDQFWMAAELGGLFAVAAACDQWRKRRNRKAKL
jgi:hypothetical protein